MLKNLIEKFLGNYRPATIGELKSISDEILYNQGIILSEGLMNRDIENLSDAEFSVYSQWGEDGIIEYLLQRIEKNVEETFIEFGIQGYHNPNTKFLLKNRNWKGLVIDSSAESISQVKNSSLYWKHDLTAIMKFVDKNNINDIFRAEKITGDIGLLSVDIDGNDYWVWKEIEVVEPAIILIEYNSTFGNRHPITVPYREDFVRTEAHYTNLYFGASLPALANLGKKKGYELIGSNTNGNNAIFVKRDMISGLTVQSPEEAWRESKFRESRDRNGNLTMLSRRERVDAIEEMPVYHVERETAIPIKDLRPLW